MKYRVLAASLLAVAGVLSSPLHAAAKDDAALVLPTVISGVVIGQAGPAGGARVVLYRDGTFVGQANLGEDGLFSFNVKPGSYAVYVYIVAYEYNPDYSTYVHVDEGQTVSLTIAPYGAES